MKLKCDILCSKLFYVTIFFLFSAFNNRFYLYNQNKINSKSQSIFEVNWKKGREVWICHSKFKIF